MEHEYKWYLGAPSDGGPGDQELLSSVQPPPGYRVAERWVSTQSNVYFDDAARGLSADDIAVTLVLSGGSPAGAVWLTCKDTLRSQRGRRDALEVEQRLDRQRLGADLDDPNLLPLLYLRRRGHDQPLDAYATARQRRQKLRVASDDGRVLLLSFDRVEFGPARGPTSLATRWLEIETGQFDEAVLADLDRWADAITALLGRPPFPLSKSRYAAAVHGWWSPPTTLAGLTEGAPHAADG